MRKREENEKGLWRKKLFLSLRKKRERNEGNEEEGGE